jgi:predicted nucleic-acid-binding Zn-ribbon protein
MKEGICPKCNASEVYHGSAAEGEGLTAGSYPSLIEIVNGKAHRTLWVDTYICRRCGYVEMHVANQEALAELEQADGWEKVEQAPY